MSTKIGNFTVTSTGNKSITGLTFMPNHIDFYMAQKPSTTENFARYASGSANGNNQMAHSIFQDGTGGKTQSYTDRCINHKNRISGSIVDVLTASFVSFDNNGGGVYGFTINVSALDATEASGKIYYVARD